MTFHPFAVLPSPDLVPRAYCAPSPECSEQGLEEREVRCGKALDGNAIWHRAGPIPGQQTGSVSME